jgi:carbamoyl-phosphate synthase large subunit
MDEIGLVMPRARFVRTMSQALEMVEEIDFPIIIRPSFTLGGTAAESHSTAKSLKRLLSAA